MKIFYTASFVAFLCLGLAACAMKVTDPNGPRFDVAEFRFEDYRGNQFDAVIKNLFPVGTSVEDVRTVFEDIWGLKPHPHDGPRGYKPPERVQKLHKQNYVIRYEYRNNQIFPFGVSWEAIFFIDPESKKLTRTATSTAAIAPM
ncbi:MAG: hypothetical protein ACQEQL_01730 [Pseudomonadota bacterium]